LGGKGQFISPGGVTADSSDNVYVSDFGENNRIQKFDSNGNFLTEWGTTGSGDGQFINPGLGIAADSADNIYVADWGNNRVQKFDSNGNFLTKWGTTGSGDGQFEEPTSIALDSS
jgi:DNA-binding beta-propeller fold protein YncE